MFVQTGQHVEQYLDECIAEPAGWPVFEFSEIQYVADDSEVGPDVRTHVNVGADDFHCSSPVALLIAWLRTRLSGHRVKLPARDQDMQLYTDQADRLSPPRLMHGRITQIGGIDHRNAAAADDVEPVVPGG